MKIDGLELDRRSFSLSRNGEPVRLDPKPLELLFLLAESAGAVISHDEALRRVWGEGVFMNGEAAIYTAIKKIRQAIGNPSLVETVPGRGYRLRIAKRAAEAPVVAEERLAVLPLANLSNDPEQQYFSDGMTEELITALSCLLRGQMSVIARTSVMRFRTESRPAEEIARELGAQYLVEGSVRCHAGRVRIGVRLLRAADSAAVWAESFERSLHDVMTLQIEIGLATAAAIGLRVGPQVGPPRVQSSSMNAEVHDRYLRARYLLGQRTRPSIIGAMRYFQEALAIDSAFAPAMASLALCHALLPITSLLRSHDCFPSAQALASDALALDATQADAQIALGLVDFWYRRDWEAARRHLEDAAQLNPGDSAPPMFLAHIHSILAEHDEGLAMLDVALRLDPISPIVRTHKGHFLYNAGRSREALGPLEQVLELAPQFWVAHLMRGKALATPSSRHGSSLESAPDYSAVVDAYSRAEQTGMGNTEPLAFRIHALASAGQRTNAMEAMGELERSHARTPAPALHRGIAVLGLGDRERAWELVEEGFFENDVRLVFLRVESRWRILGEERYLRALERASLPLVG